LAVAGLTRRSVLQGLGAVSIAGCGPAKSLPPIDGRITGRVDAERGHRLRGAFAPGEGPAEECDVCIVGGGVAGLTAAWRLGRAGVRNVELLELGDRLGGTAAAGESAFGAHPLGAHYVTLPNPGARHMHALLADAGVLIGGTAAAPQWDPLALAFAPQERLYDAGVWSEGLWPTTAGSEAAAQRESFDAHCAQWTAAVGADGLRAFEIPLWRSSRDPAVRALADESFAAYCDRHGWTDPALRWWLRYGVRDDYGAEPEDVSAWAGLHYHCARAPAVVDDLGTRVLTWPSGNGHLVAQLARGLARPPRLGAVVRRVERVGDATEVWFERDGLRRIRCRHAVLAVPAMVADVLTGRVGPGRPTAAPWRVAALSVERLPASRGLAAAWDSVVMGSESLGYVSSGHQRLGRGGGAVLSWYEPLSRGEPRAQGRRLLEAEWAAEVDRVLSDLASAHADLRSVVRRVDVQHWGHGTVRPTVGLHGGDGLASLATPWPGISFAHTDNSGLSLFEEASWHGVRAAEEALGFWAGGVGAAAARGGPMTPERGESLL